MACLGLGMISQFEEGTGFVLNLVKSRKSGGWSGGSRRRLKLESDCTEMNT